MKKMILNCYWNPGTYDFVCDFDETNAHYEVKCYRPLGAENRAGELSDEELKVFLEMIDEFDFDSINHEDSFPDEGIMMDIPMFEFLYVDNNKFYTSRWQIHCETEEIEQIKDLIAYCDPKFNDLFQ